MISVAADSRGLLATTGVLRATIIRAKLKANLADSLIAQGCIDHDLPLITYDGDFDFVDLGLKLL